MSAVSVSGLGFGSVEEPGPGFFPCAVGITLLITGLGCAYSSLRRPSGDTTGENLLAPGSLFRVACMVLAYVAWLLLMPFLGYAFGTVAVSIAMAKTLGLKGWIRPVVLSVAIALVIYFLFDVWFYVDLPRGILG